MFIYPSVAILRMNTNTYLSFGCIHHLSSILLPADTRTLLCTKTNHYSQQRMNDQYWFQHEYKAVSFDKTTDFEPT